MIMGNATADEAKGIEVQLITNQSIQDPPSIYGDNIVWTDYSSEYHYVYIYNISTSEKKRVNGYDSYQYKPMIHLDRVVWADSRNGNYDIYMYNTSTFKEIPIATDLSVQINPAIYGDLIVWEDSRNMGEEEENWDIYMYNLSTSQETRITTNESFQFRPSIYGDVIVWQDNRNGNWDIYMYNISTSTETQITTNDEFWQGEAAIYGDNIVWTDNRNGNSDIYVYNISTLKEKQITTNELWQITPAIYKDRIVWQDGRNWDGYDNNDIYMYNLSTSTETQITTNKSLQGRPAIYEDRIIWLDYRNGYPNADIYMFILQGDKPTIYPPVANFTATPLSGKAPLKVKFTSTSKSSPTEWKWNFGDGSPLVMEQNPEHTYSKAGVYTVKHTAINALGRDTEIKTKYITVTSPALPLKAPKAAFSAAPRSGKAPLKVQFTDKSTGTPTSWKWSFGDGKYSTAKSPEHTYSKAGKYNVALTVKNAKGSSTKTICGYIIVAKK